jgi:hypothetical protein
MKPWNFTYNFKLGRGCRASPWVGVEPTTSVVMGTNCIDSCSSNYHTITATTAPSG